MCRGRLKIKVNKKRGGGGETKLGGVVNGEFLGSSGVGVKRVGGEWVLEAGGVLPRGGDEEKKEKENGGGEIPQIGGGGDKKEKGTWSNRGKLKKKKDTVSDEGKKG